MGVDHHRHASGSNMLRQLMTVLNEVANAP